MTNQEIFTKVVQHLRQQGKPAKRGAQCAYRGDGGTMCAVGCLIPDEHYNSSFEGMSIKYKPIILLLQDLYPTIDTWLLLDLQQLHDDLDPDRWESEFSKLADAYGLELPEQVC